MEVALFQNKKESYSMEMTPNKWCLWKVTPNYLEEALKQLSENGVEKLSVVPDLTSGTGAELRRYLIIYFNPQTIPPESTDGAPVGATIQ